MTNTLTHSRNSLENHTRFPTILYGQSLYMFSDRNGAKTIPFGVACAYYWISLYTPPQAKKPLVIARLLTPSPPKKKQQQQQIYCWSQLLIASLHEFIKRGSHTAISRKVVGKSARDNPERHCGWFWVLFFFSKKFERIGTKGHANMFASAKGKQQK